MLVCKTIFVATSVVAALSCRAQISQPASEGERLFVEGTALFQGKGVARDPKEGLKKLLASAELRYAHASYGLCIALSAEPEVLNLVESYAWCEVASGTAGRFAGAAKSRATEVLGRIAVHDGGDQVSEAKRRAAQLSRKHGAA